MLCNPRLRGVVRSMRDPPRDLVRRTPWLDQFRQFDSVLCETPPPDPQPTLAVDVVAGSHVDRSSPRRTSPRDGPTETERRMNAAALRVSSSVPLGWGGGPSGTN